MKRSILIIAFALIASFASAQKMNAKDVPALVTSAFAKQFPTIKEPKWEKEDGNYEANFDLNKVETTAVFDDKGTLLQTESEIKLSELPKVVLDYMKKTYPDRKIKEASKIKDAKGILTYEIETKGMNMIFDAKGNFLKEEK